jgi:hypothetical protein
VPAHLPAGAFPQLGPPAIGKRSFFGGDGVGDIDDRHEPSAIDEITKLVIRYADGFAGDPNATPRFYALPMIFVGPETVTVIASRKKAVAFVENILEQLRPIGFSHSTVERCFVRLLKPSIALCCIDGTRRRADGSSIARIGATYVLTAHPDWRIRELIATDPENVGPSPPHSGR